MQTLQKRAIQVGDLAWERFFHPRTSLMYDYVTTYDPAHRFDTLPTLEEIGRQQPNTNGWGTGMEDSTINGGVLMATMCDRYDATGDAALHSKTAALLDGLELCATCSDAEGFVARSVSPRDGKSFFIETSRDQLTHFAHGLWRYAHSPLSTANERARMRSSMAALCRRLDRFVVPENDFHFCKVNGERGLVDKMWNVAPHEAPRLPMIYAVGWDLTGDAHWHDRYRRTVGQALEQARTLKVADYDWCYALFQHQVSMEVLCTVETEDGNLRRGWREEMRRIARGIAPFLSRAQEYRSADVQTVNMDWRARPDRNPDSSYGHVPAWPEEMLREFRPMRELGEALLIRLLSPEGELAQEEQDELAHGLHAMNCETMFTYAMHYPPAAFWRLAANRTRQKRS